MDFITYLLNIKTQGSSNYLYLFIYTAAQMWCLARLLPLMIGHKVPKNDRHWLNFLQMLDIIDIVFAPVITQDQIAFLRIIIKEHHESFVQLYPHCNITPKLHYMIHYPHWMSRYASRLSQLTVYMYLCYSIKLGVAH